MNELRRLITASFAHTAVSFTEDTRERSSVTLHLFELIASRVLPWTFTRSSTRFARAALPSHTMMSSFVPWTSMPSSSTDAVTWSTVPLGVVSSGFAPCDGNSSRPSLFSSSVPVSVYVVPWSSLTWCAASAVVIAVGSEHGEASEHALPVPLGDAYSNADTSTQVLLATRHTPPDPQSPSLVQPTHTSPVLHAAVVAANAAWSVGVHWTRSWSIVS